jgi:hypothetical protein
MIVDALAAIGRRTATGRDRDFGPLNPPVEDLTMTEMFHGTLPSPWQVIGIAQFEKPSAAGTADGSAGFLLTIIREKPKCLQNL